MENRAIWPQATTITTDRLDLEPLRVEHAPEAAPLFDDERLHEFTGGEPATAAQLRERYRRQALGHAPDGTQGWLNWMLRRRPDGDLVGTVQATVSEATVSEGDSALVADLAWIIGTPFQGRGYATEAAAAVVEWLRARDVVTVRAHVHPDHRVSAGVAAHLGMVRAGRMVDGEECWELAQSPRPRSPGAQTRR